MLKMVQLALAMDLFLGVPSNFGLIRPLGAGPRPLRADPLQEFSVLHGYGRDEHVLLGEKSVVSFQGSDELIEQLQAFHWQ